MSLLAEIKVSAALQDIASRLDALFRDLTDEKFNFSLIVYKPEGQGEYTSYIANNPREKSIEVLEDLLKRWKEELPDTPVHHNTNTELH